MIIVGNKDNQQLAHELQGLVATSIIDWTNRLTLGELGALCEVADLYVGNNVDYTYIAVAADCPTLLILGEKRPLTTIPYASAEQLTPLWQSFEGNFSWEKGVSVHDTIKAIQKLLKIRI